LLINDDNKNNDNNDEDNYKVIRLENISWDWANICKQEFLRVYAQY
jgi:hypothetical protein